jgi:hypothetical protein
LSAAAIVRVVCPAKGATTARRPSECASAAARLRRPISGIELRHDHRHGLAELVGRLDGGDELRPAVERVGALAVSISLKASAMR